MPGWHVFLDLYRDFTLNAWAAQLANTKNTFTHFDGRFEYRAGARARNFQIGLHNLGSTANLITHGGAQRRGSRLRVKSVL